MKKQNVRTISLIVCTFTYLLIGAAVFDALESETEKKRWKALSGLYRRDSSLHPNTLTLIHSWLDFGFAAIENVLINRYNISAEDFKVIETVIMKSEPHKAGQQWKFSGAFYYATTVLTTIGYGHSTPSTVSGKIFTMCYAAIGIPLGLVMFQSIGERVNRLSSVIVHAVKTSFNCKKAIASEVDLILVVTTLSSLTIAGGAAAFSKFEGWSYFDSVYYCFITLTTIGFGDMVALQKDNALNKKPEYVAFALIFILFGLAVVAASLNLLVLRFVTMNTEDEKRDEAQAIQALQIAVKLDGDIITGNTGDSVDERCYERISVINPLTVCHNCPTKFDMTEAGNGCYIDTNYRYPLVDCEMTQLRSPADLRPEGGDDQGVQDFETDDEGLIQPLRFEYHPSRGRASV
ncbi:two pore potassium channel protein sup-9 isoform X1 [Anopheles darlingi]|uniref:two pore potassium channel protein sup-9 isoform X1 n=1 Tax=Anopheles darlingi TaxID=43151 RepID=UPI002100546D|nr:two pore potassium channel protein sup-9 isoform X1 [Anopheles darlingi]